MRAVIAQRNDIRAMAHRFACGGLLNVFRRGESSRPASSRREQKKTADEVSTACAMLIPPLDELRTFCYEHKAEGIPALIAV